jgi:hypothetical protein
MDFLADAGCPNLRKCCHISPKSLKIGGDSELIKRVQANCKMYVCPCVFILFLLTFGYPAQWCAIINSRTPEA